MFRKKKKSRQVRGYKRRNGGGKRNRGAGNRGGRGRAGQGKRAGHNKIKYIVEEGANFLGVHGFTSVRQAKRRELVAVNTDHIDQIAHSLVEKKLAVKTKEGIEIDLGKIGYQKLLGKGKVKNKLIITVEEFTESAKAKIEEAGGKIIGGEAEEEAEPAEEK